MDSVHSAGAARTRCLLRRPSTCSGKEAPDDRFVRPGAAPRRQPLGLACRLAGRPRRFACPCAGAQRPHAGSRPGPGRRAAPHPSAGPIRARPGPRCGADRGRAARRDGRHRDGRLLRRPLDARGPVSQRRARRRAAQPGDRPDLGGRSRAGRHAGGPHRRRRGDAGLGRLLPAAALRRAHVFSRGADVDASAAGARLGLPTHSQRVRLARPVGGSLGPVLRDDRDRPGAVRRRLRHARFPRRQHRCPGGGRRLLPAPAGARAGGALFRRRRSRGASPRAGRPSSIRASSHRSSAGPSTRSCSRPTSRSRPSGRCTGTAALDRCRRGTTATG